MRSLSFPPITIVLLIAIIGVFTVKAKEATRSTYDTAYFSTGSGTEFITASSSIFDDASITCYAALKKDNGIYLQLYKNSDLTGPVKILQ